MEANWREDALCLQLGMPTEMFYVEPDTEAEQIAKSVCSGCIAVSQCLEDSMETRDYHGVQGGLTGVERSRLFNKIKRVRNGKRT